MRHWYPRSLAEESARNLLDCALGASCFYEGGHRINRELRAKPAAFIALAARFQRHPQSYLPARSYTSHTKRLYNPRRARARQSAKTTASAEDKALVKIP